MFTLIHRGARSCSDNTIVLSSKVNALKEPIFWADLALGIITFVGGIVLKRTGLLEGSFNWISGAGLGYTLLVAGIYLFPLCKNTVYIIKERGVCELLGEVRDKAVRKLGIDVLENVLRDGHAQANAQN